MCNFIYWCYFKWIIYFKIIFFLGKLEIIILKEELGRVKNMNRIIIKIFMWYKILKCVDLKFVY